MAIRKFAVALLSVFMAVTSLAANKDLEKDITMVSYEQAMLKNTESSGYGFCDAMPDIYWEYASGK